MFHGDDCCNKEAPPIESVCLRHDTFWAIAELAGRALEDLSPGLTKVLSGDRWMGAERRRAVAVGVTWNCGNAIGPPLRRL